MWVVERLSDLVWPEGFEFLNMNLSQPLWFVLLFYKVSPFESVRSEQK